MRVVVWLMVEKYPNHTMELCAIGFGYRVSFVASTYEGENAESQKCCE